MFVDFLYKGRGHGPVGEGMNEVRWENGLRRPYINENGVRCVTVNTGRSVYDKEKKIYRPELKCYAVDDLARHGMVCPVANATSLRKDQWRSIDTAVIRAARQRLRAWADLAASSTVSGFDGMGTLTYEYEVMSDPGSAQVDMEGTSDGRTDNPLWKLRSMPLPIIHSDFMFSERFLAVSRNKGTPVDTLMAEAAGRRVAEIIEQMTIGTVTGPTYGTRSNEHDGSSKIYGYTNLPSRITKADLNTPTGSNPEAVMTDVLEMIDLMQNNKFYGPYMLYTSTGYSRYLNDDYFRSGSTSAVRSLRDRIMDIEGIQDIRRLDYLTSGYQMILVQMDPEVARAIIGMPITTVQWDSQGGMRHNFKVMCIMVPQLRFDYNGTAAIVHATTS